MVRIYMLWLNNATKSCLLFPHTMCFQCVYGDTECCKFGSYCASKIACSWSTMYIYN